jgi:NACHT domain
MPGIHILSKMIATDATHDTCERYPPPNVHTGTRTKILEVLTAWINDQHSECRVFWLHGPAGAGKSAILQALAELLMSSEGPVVGSFFFGKGQGKRGSGDYLFSTLAYQLAVNMHGLRAYVDEVLQSDPTLPTKSMEIQLRTLIIEPFQRLQSLPSRIQTVIVDGLDECQGDETQKLILQLIGDALTKYNLPLRFLIASRPEPHIRDGFDSPNLLPITNRLMLHDDFRTRNDIEKYLQDGFLDICSKSRSMIHVKMPWPGEDVINTLTRHACGQFIYAATVLKFVGQKSTYPPKQLDIVLRPHPLRGKAFSDLDCLYFQILSTHPDPKMLVRVFSTILGLQRPQPIIVIEDILETEKGEILDVLQGLHSLLEVPDDNISQSDSDDDDQIRGPLPRIRIRHASFRDYLLDKNRSGTFYIDKPTLDQLHISIFSMTSNRILRSAYRQFMDGPSRELNPDTRLYIRHHLLVHLKALHNCFELNKVASEFEQQFSNRIKDPSSVPFKVLYEIIEPLSVGQLFDT